MPAPWSPNGVPRADGRRQDFHPRKPSRASGRDRCHLGQAAGKHIDRPKAATLEEAIDQCVELNMERLDAPGAAVAVVLDGELIYESGYGVKVRGGDDGSEP